MIRVFLRPCLVSFRRSENVSVPEQPCQSTHLARGCQPPPPLPPLYRVRDGLLLIGLSSSPVKRTGLLPEHAAKREESPNLRSSFPPFYYTPSICHRNIRIKLSEIAR